MNRCAYYNEIDPYCVQWLKNLISADLLPPGDIDSRSITDVQSEDLKSYTQCHFFAGLGGWPYALTLARWPDDRPIWTGSCPCQPFSVAGKRAGVRDKRHLWPDFYRLIHHHRPVTVMGEQVAGALGYAWLGGVVADLEEEGYAVRGVDIPACSVGAPHQRNRIYWVAYSSEQPERKQEHKVCSEPWQDTWVDSGRSGSRFDGMAYPFSERLAVGQISDDKPGIVRQKRKAVKQGGAGVGRLEHTQKLGRREGWARDEVRSGRDSTPGASGSTGGLGNSTSSRSLQTRPEALQEIRVQARSGELERRSGDGRPPGYWNDWVLIGPDPKDKYRRTKSGVRLLVDRAPSCVARLRALGNAIVPELAAEVIRAWMDVMP